MYQFHLKFCFLVGLEAIPILLSFIAHSNMKPFLSNRFDRYMLPEKTYEESEQEV